MLRDIHALMQHADNVYAAIAQLEIGHVQASGIFEVTFAHISVSPIRLPFAKSSKAKMIVV